MFQTNNNDTRPEQRQLFVGKYEADQLVPHLSRVCITERKNVYRGILRSVIYSATILTA